MEDAGYNAGAQVQYGHCVPPGHDLHRGGLHPQQEAHAGAGELQPGDQRVDHPRLHARTQVADGMCRSQ